MTLIRHFISQVVSPLGLRTPRLLDRQLSTHVGSDPGAALTVIE